ncbi:MAG: L-lactate permease [Acidobacteria bacterium]|nr:L-lactate permease [Acidobacteriota bacterium]
MPWIQVYDPLGNAWLSTLAAAVPIVLLLCTLGLFRWPAHRAALASLAAAVAISIAVFGMPVRAAVATVAFGAAYGLFPIGWIVLAAIFLYNLSVRSGTFETVKHSVSRLSGDRRVQALLIAFSFGAFIEGASGFGTPVAISAALLMGLGFAPQYAATLALIANTAPVAFGALGTPILTLAAVTGLPAFTLGAMAGRQLPFVALLIPAWLVVTMSGWRGLRGVWPAVLACGGSFALAQFFWSNWIGPELAGIAAGLCSLACVGAVCAWWRPTDGWNHSTRGFDAAAADEETQAVSREGLSRRAIIRAWLPWILLSVFVAAWGATPIKNALTNASPWFAPRMDVPGLHRLVLREYPVVAERAAPALAGDPAYLARRAEGATFTFNWLSATGTGILFAALATIVCLRIPRRTAIEVARATAWQMRRSLLTISLMMAIGFVTRYGGTDATLGLAFTRTGWFYPFFAAMLGWLGVALTGSDTSSNVLFGSLQTITAGQLGLNPILIATANSTGGVMGKMIDAQTIVVAGAATGQEGHEGALLRAVFWHSLVLAAIMGLIVLAQAYVVPWMVPGN